jgi:hypothetical protein
MLRRIPDSLTSFGRHLIKHVALLLLLGCALVAAVLAAADKIEIAVPADSANQALAHRFVCSPTVCLRVHSFF